jgi:hypothetical protein
MPVSPRKPTWVPASPNGREAAQTGHGGLPEAQKRLRRLREAPTNHRRVKRAPKGLIDRVTHKYRRRSQGDRESPAEHQKARRKRTRVPRAPKEPVDAAASHRKPEGAEDPIAL